MRANKKIAQTASLLLAVIVFGNCLGAQSGRPTIPQLLQQEGHSTQGFKTEPSGFPPAVDSILNDSDTVLVGTVGEAHSYLSADERDVFTDYQINEVAVYYQKNPVVSKVPGPAPPVIVTIHGGTVTVGGLQYTFKELALPSLPIGSRCLFLLKRTGDRYRIAGDYYGAFRISESDLVPLTAKQRFASEYKGMLAQSAINEMVRILKSKAQ